MIKVEWIKMLKNHLVILKETKILLVHQNTIFN